MELEIFPNAISTGQTSGNTSIILFFYQFSLFDWNVRGWNRKSSCVFRFIFTIIMIRDEKKEEFFTFSLLYSCVDEVYSSTSSWGWNLSRSESFHVRGGWSSREILCSVPLPSCETVFGSQNLILWCRPFPLLCFDWSWWGRLSCCRIFFQGRSFVFVCMVVDWYLHFGPCEH